MWNRLETANGDSRKNQCREKTLSSRAGRWMCRHKVMLFTTERSRCDAGTGKKWEPEPLFFMHSLDVDVMIMQWWNIMPARSSQKKFFTLLPFVGCWSWAEKRYFRADENLSDCLFWNSISSNSIVIIASTATIEFHSRKIYTFIQHRVEFSLAVEIET